MDPQLPRLSWDARGHGTSARFTPGQLDDGVGETMLADAVAVLESLDGKGLGRPLLVGHSMGGGTAGAVAASRPDLIRGAVLEDPALGEDPSESLADRLRAGDERVDDAQLWHDDPETALAMGLADNEGWPPDEYPGWARSKTQTDLSMLATGQARVRRSWLDVAAEIAAPSLMLTCDDPLLWDEESLARLRGLATPSCASSGSPGADTASGAASPRPSTPSWTRGWPSTHDRWPVRPPWGRPEGPTLVLFHGNGDSGRCWPDAVERWAPDHRVLAVDARGHGRSPRFTTAELDRLGEVFTDDTEAVLEDVRRTAGAYSVLAVGHSLGAGTLAAVMARRPDLLNAAVLIDPPWDSPLVGPEPRPEIGGARVEFIVACLADPAGARAEQAAHNPAWSSAEQRAWLEAKQEVDLAMVAIGNGRVASPWPGLCARIANPTLVVTATLRGACWSGSRHGRRSPRSTTQPSRWRRSPGRTTTCARAPRRGSTPSWTRGSPRTSDLPTRGPSGAGQGQC